MSWFAPPVVSVVYTTIPDGDELPLSPFVARLAADEQQRAAKFRHDADRARFVFGRLLLRHLVALLTRDEAGAPAADAIRIGLEEGGRPYVIDPPFQLFVSLAHSGKFVAVAACRRPVGIDIEQRHENSPRTRIAERVCSPRELGQLEALSGEARERAFMAIWARKESYGKALGVGLGFDMRAVTVGPGGSRVLGVRPRWHIEDLDIDPGYAAALVVAGRRARVRVAEVDSASL